MRLPEGFWLTRVCLPCIMGSPVLHLQLTYPHARLWAQLVISESLVSQKKKKKARNLDLFKIRYHLIYKCRRLIIIDRVCGQENHNIRARFTLSYQSVNSTQGYTLCKSRKSRFFFSSSLYIHSANWLTHGGL